jgi:hypothetical protein
MTVAGWLVTEPDAFEQASESVYVPDEPATTVRGDTAEVTSDQPLSVVELPLSIT